MARLERRFAAGFDRPLTLDDGRFIQVADKALYAAKASGRNCVSFAYATVSKTPNSAA